MSNRVKVNVDIDREKAKMVRKALRELPAQFRDRQIINAQKKIMKPTKDETVRVLKSKINSTSLDGRSVQVVKGKYTKKTRPYVVVQAADRQRLARRFRAKYSTTLYTNFFKIDHILAMGSKAGLRRAGTSVRHDRAGRDRVKLYNEDGSPSIRRMPTSGRYFLVQGPKGLHPIKQIKHPGAEPSLHYDEALAKTNRAARNKFYDYVADEITKYKRRKGLK